MQAQPVTNRLAPADRSARADAQARSACRLFVSGLRASDEQALEHALRKHGATDAHVRIDERAPAIHCVWTRRQGRRTPCGNFVLRFRPCPPELCGWLPAPGGSAAHAQPQPQLWMDEPVLSSDRDMDEGENVGDSAAQLCQLLMEALMECMPAHQCAWVMLPASPLAQASAATAAQPSGAMPTASLALGMRHPMSRMLFSTALALMGLCAVVVGSGLAH